MIDGKYAVYAENEIDLPFSIGTGVVCDENQTG